MVDRKHRSAPRQFSLITQEGISMKAKFPLFHLTLVALIFTATSHAQDWVHAGTNLGNARIRLGAADFKQVGADPQTPALKATFDATLFNDLQTAGIFDMVSKSMARSRRSTWGSGRPIRPRRIWWRLARCAAIMAAWW